MQLIDLQKLVEKQKSEIDILGKNYARILEEICRLKWALDGLAKHLNIEIKYAPVYECVDLNK